MKRIIKFTVLLGLIFLLMPEQVMTCTSFSFEHEGAVIFATNYDNDFAPGMIYVNKKNVQKRGWEPGTSGKTAAWVSRYGSVTFSCVGYQLAWAGMNEAGLVMSTMSLAETKNPPPDERPALVSPFWVQYMLDTCATVEEVIESDRRIRISDTHDHYLVCDGKGNCAAIEFLEGKMVTHTRKNLPVKALANMLYSVCADHWKRRAALPANPYHSIHRFVRAADMMASYKAKKNKTALDYAFKILNDVADPYPREGRTRWSIVFDTKNFKIYYRSYNNKKVRWIDFSKFDFDCHAPVKMLQVHNDLSGSVSDSFVDYSHELTLNLLLPSLKHFRPNFPQESIIPLLQMIENFPCKSEDR